MNSANTIMLNCPINPTKYNSHYSPLSNIHACVVSSQTAMPETFTYNQDVTDKRGVDL